MRLDNKEIEALRFALEDVDDEVYLFGSRVDDYKKGGDIDLLVFSKKPSYKLSQDISVNFFKICEEKIDVIVMDRDNLSKEQQAFIDTLNMEKLIL